LSAQTAPTIRWLRAVRVGLHLVQGVSTAALLFPLLSHAMRRRLVQSWSAKLLAILNVRLTVRGNIPQRAGTGLIFAANHISWLDIYLLNALHPLRFVSKSEVRAWPLIGFLAAKAGTLFIERSRRHDTLRANQTIESALRNGDHIALFPEGTTTDGSHVQHFHAALLQPAIDADTPVQAVTIAYFGKNREIDTAPAYIGELSFGDSFQQILRRPTIHAEVHFAAILAPHGKDRRQLAGALHNIIVGALRPTPSGPSPGAMHPDAPAK